MAEHGRRGEGWELFPHEADIGVRGFGREPAEAFSNAAQALTAAVSPLAGVALRKTVTVTCEASALDVLFVDWLNAVIYEMATRGMLFCEFDVAIDGGRLTATLCGELVDIARHAPAVEPKGATFTGLSVRQEASGGWIAECIVDV